jgi:hypothetical protein
VDDHYDPKEIETAMSNAEYVARLIVEKEKYREFIESFRCTNRNEKSDHRFISAFEVDELADPAEIEFSLLNSGLISRLKDEQNKDPGLIPIIRFLQSATISSDTRVAQDVMRRANQMNFINGLLVQHNPGVRNSPVRVVVPNTHLRKELILHFHAHIFNGAHQGFDKVYEKLARRFWWKGMFKQTKEILASCMECQMTKTPHLKPAAAALSPPVVPGPLEKIAIDVVGPLPLSNHGNKCLLVIIDYATKWCEAYPLRDQQATEAALCLADWVSRFGAPLAMTSDRGSAFISALVKEFCKLWDVNHDFTSAYHPQSNAQVERLNATL